jgi:CMP-N-acetylneuraminic acid synthetase
MIVQVVHDSVICVIPARMGSTRIKRKNLRELSSRLTLVGQAIRTAGTFKVCISTDEPESFASFNDVLIIKRPASISDAESNVSHAITHALEQAEIYYKTRFDIVVTLMPAIAGRSGSILIDMLNKFTCSGHISSAMTSAATHPWLWKIFDDGKTIQNTWFPHDQKNSQDLPTYLVEHASIIINKRAVVINEAKWMYPLMLYSLPSWAVALDIDTEMDLHHARLLYPAMEPLLNEWVGETYIAYSSCAIMPDR